MPYIGVSPQFGVRRKHTYTATASQTSFSGAGSEGATLSYTDSNFVDVYQNGVKLGDADYTSTSGTAIVLAQGASVDDLIEIIVFDAFSAADTVSKADGGTFDGAVTLAGGVSGDIANVSGDMTIDVAGDIILDADGGDVTIKDGGTTVGNIGNDSTDLYIAGTTHGLKFDSIDASTMYIRPVNNSGSNVTGQIDLGQSGNVFRDAYVSGGVYFAPHSHPANYLDDYEEGSWTPTWSGSSGGSATYSYQVARYTKVGNRVFANCYLAISNNSLSGSLSLNGLPFASASISQLYHSVTIWINTTTNGGAADGDFFLQGFIDHNGSSSVFLYSLDGDGGSASFTASNLTNTTDIMINASYQTN